MGLVMLNPPKRKMPKLYIVFTETNVKLYKSNAWDKMEGIDSSFFKFKFKTKLAKKAFITGLEFAGMAKDSDFMIISKVDYKKLNYFFEEKNKEENK